MTKKERKVQGKRRPSEGLDAEAREDKERKLRQCMAKRQVYIWMRNWERDTQELEEFRWEEAG